jgi:lysophospholipase L1-like esterase
VSPNKSYFFQSFAIVAISIASLMVFKQFLPKKIFTETSKMTKNVVIDSLLLEAVEAEGGKAEKDTLSNTKITFEATNGIKFPAEAFENYKGFQHLISFYEKLVQLEQTGQGNIRIAYFGDSMTDGDMIVKDFRSSMQNRFGGEGVGFVNITSESAPSRTTLEHKFSSNWKTLSYLNIKNPRSPFGVNGHVFFTKKDTVNPVWVKYKALQWRHVNQLNAPTLFYGKSGNSKGKVAFIIGKDTIYKPLNPAATVNTLQVTPGAVKSLRANFIAADTIPFYGFNFDDGRGVHVDNFSNRGNSGLPISTFSPKVMKAFHEKLGYDLIVLHYGTNVLNYGSYNYSWYEKRMANVVEHLRKCFPGAAILVVSTADKGTKYDLEMKTDSAVAPLTMAQKRYAVKTNAAYVNLYTLMGGDGSMVKWVEEVPPLANKDYTHFNFRGSKKIAELIYNQLNDGYEQYKKLRGVRSIAPAKPAPAAPKKPGAKKDSVTYKTDSTHAG